MLLTAFWRFIRAISTVVVVVTEELLRDAYFVAAHKSVFITGCNRS